MAKSGKALALLSDPSDYIDDEAKELQLGLRSGVIQEDVHWQWRLRNVEKLAAQLDPDRFGVKGFYLFGSVKNAHAGPSSDIDVLIHFTGTELAKKRSFIMVGRLEFEFEPDQLFKNRE